MMGDVKKQRVLVTALFAPEGASFNGPQWKPGTELPTSLLVLRSGSNPSNKGIFKVDDVTSANFSSVMRERGRDRVTIDFEHNTLPGSPAYKQATEPRPIAGRGIPALTPLGVELRDIEWTAEGRKMAEHFGDISPAPWHTEDLTVIGLHSVGLVRNGAIYDLTFCSADAGSMETQTNPEENESMKTLLAALTAAKLIPENGTETDVVALITGLQAKQTAADTALAGITALTADQVKVIAKEIAKAEVTALTAEVTTLKSESLKIQKGHILELAKHEGKVVALTADVIDSLTLDQLKDQVSKIKVTIPLDQRTRTTGLDADAGRSQVTDDQKKIARACGMDPEKVFGKVAALVIAFLLSACGISQAAALSAERDTPQRLNQYTSLTVASNAIIYAGSLVCVNSSGLAVPAADSSGFAVVGRAEATADNRGVLYVATKTIKVARGTFQWKNADAIVAADIGKLVYVTDDQTVNKTGGGQNIIAGTVVDVDSSGVWVDTAKVGPVGAATPSSLAVSGTATVGSTLGVTGAIVGSSTVAATGFKIGAVSGYSGAITNISSLSTNIMKYAGGVLTNSVNVP